VAISLYQAPIITAAVKAAAGGVLSPGWLGTHTPSPRDHATSGSPSIIAEMGPWGRIQGDFGPDLTSVLHLTLLLSLEIPERASLERRFSAGRENSQLYSATLSMLGLGPTLGASNLHCHVNHSTISPSLGSLGWHLEPCGNAAAGREIMLAFRHWGWREMVWRRESAPLLVERCAQFTLPQNTPSAMRT